MARGVQYFVGKLKERFGEDTFDWIDAHKEATKDLKHVDEDDLNQAKFEIEAGLSIEGLTEKEVEEIDREIRRFVDDKDVDVRVKSSSGNFSVYCFYLHARMLDVDC